MEDAEITLRSDHLPLKRFLQRNTLNTKVNNWTVEISPFKITFEYIKGIKNTLADTKITFVSKMAQQEEGRQLDESIELADPLNKRIEEILKVKDEAPSLTSYPFSESLQEFESDEIEFWTKLVLCNKG